LPPLDKFRKIRRDVLQTINDLRAKFPDTLPLNHDEFGNHAADEYAHFLLTDEPNDATLYKLCEYHNVINPTKCVAVYGFSHLEDDFESPDKTRHAEFMDAHGLLLELQKEMKMLADKQYTHIGIGLAMDAGKVLIVEVLTTKHFTIDRLNQSENGGVEVVGRIFPSLTVGGMYAARICMLSNQKKQYGEAGPEHMHVEEIKGTKMKMFSINFKPI